MIRTSWTIAVVCALLVVIGLASRHQPEPELTPNPATELDMNLDEEQRAIRVLHEKNRIAGEESMAVVRTLLERSPYHLAAAPVNLEALPTGAFARLGRVALSSTYRCAVSPDCKRLAVVNSLGITIYELPSLVILRQMPKAEETVGTLEMRFLEDRLLLGIYEKAPHLIHIWDVETGHLAMLGQVGSEDPNQVKLQGGSIQIDEKTRLFVIHRNADRPDSYYEIWQTFPLKQLHVVKLNNGVMSGWQLSADGSALLGWGYYPTNRGNFVVHQKKVAIVDTQTGQVRVWIDFGICNSAWTNCAISRDGERVAIMIDEGKLVVHDARKGTLLTTIDCGKSQKRYLSYDRQGRLVIMDDGGIRVVDDKTGAELAKYDMVEEYRERRSNKERAQIEFPRAGSPLFYRNDTVRDILELDTGKNLTTSAVSQYGVGSLTFSEDGKTLHTLDGDSTYQQWDIGKRVQAYPFAKTLYDAQYQSRYTTSSLPELSWDGKKLFSTVTRRVDKPGGYEARAVAIDTTTGRELYSNLDLPESNLRKTNMNEFRLIQNSNSKWLAYEDRYLHSKIGIVQREVTSDIKIRNTETGKTEATLSLKNAEGIGIAFSPDGQHILITSNDSRVNLPSRVERNNGEGKGLKAPVSLAYYNLRTLKKVQEGTLSTIGHAIPLISPDSRHVVLVHNYQYVAMGSMREYTLDDTRLASWDLLTGEVREYPPTYYGGRGARPVLSPCGRFFVLVTMGDYQTNRFGVPDKNFEKANLKESSRNQVVRVFETSTLTQRFEWPWPVKKWMQTTDSLTVIPDGGVASLAVSPDSKTLAAGMGSGTVLLCDMSLKAGPQFWVDKPSTLPALWEKFTHRDAEQGWPAMRELVGRPEVALSLLRKQVQPQMPGDKPSPAQFAELVAGLSHREYTERERATIALEKLGRLVELELRQALKEANSPEAQDRMKRILNKMKDRPEDYWEPRAVEVLEAIDNQPSRDLLREWSKAERSTILARESQAALKRLSKAE